MHAPLLPQIADHLEAQQRSVIAGQSETRAGGHLAWQDALALAMKHPVSTSPDLIALARICRCARNNPDGTPGRLRDALDLKLQTSVIRLLGHGRDADNELVALHDDFMALQYEERTLSRTLADDDDAADERREALTRQQKTIICQSRTHSPATLVGYQAIARMLLAWNNQIKPSSDDSDPGEVQLLWQLLHGLLGVEQATAFASDDPDIVLQAITSRLEQNGFVLEPGLGASSVTQERVR